ncbi:hypothetical protein B4U79_04024 [Dinothrombium tinctorium]|uniref:Ubiquinone biosynthesis protein COQ4 homolog, mitochondrial n=1 Tax=Dinothrombium tinctorium TaxID=1965070 RepID=A0A3S3PIT6_9ACAR|nr:hypothetical protein B4U79_02922 [Dinothrombium tinctorium]RWS13313.1 hypothetical protein B4U79_04630 [Dinothrombium tinctorium]RWS15027.1 hypothetical protein B4U79_04180 [Dinothrombium tinctorium]RWS15035.1 hypothetical protein B4U79_04024 [Dinothrombium tinctorium]
MNIRQLQKLYPRHIPTTTTQKLLLAIGSSATALIDPLRDGINSIQIAAMFALFSFQNIQTIDMVAVSGEVLGGNALRKMYRQMRSSEEGRRVLIDKPIINTKVVDLNELSRLPKGTFGAEYVRFMTENKISSDTRKPVKFVDDPELAYVMQRYRETHDMVHVLTAMPISLPGEVAVKWIEAIQTGLPMCWGAAIFGPLTLNREERRDYIHHYLQWALKCGHEAKPFITYYYEKRLEQNIDDLRREMNIPLPLPHLR